MKAHLISVTIVTSKIRVTTLISQITTSNKIHPNSHLHSRNTKEFVTLYKVMLYFSYEKSYHFHETFQNNL